MDEKNAAKNAAGRGWIGFIEDFVRGLDALPRGDVAKIATGKSRGDSMGVFYKILPYQLKKHDDLLYIVATAFAICKGGDRLTGSFGKTMRVVKMNGGSESTDRRFATLLDSDAGNGELERRLIQMAKLARSKGAGIDWKQLSIDVINWSNEGKPVQKQWAFDYFGNRPVDRT